MSDIAKSVIIYMLFGLGLLLRPHFSLGYIICNIEEVHKILRSMNVEIWDSQDSSYGISLFDMWKKVNRNKVSSYCETLRYV